MFLADLSRLLVTARTPRSGPSTPDPAHRSEDRRLARPTGGARRSRPTSGPHAPDPPPWYQDSDLMRHQRFHLDRSEPRPNARRSEGSRRSRIAASRYATALQSRSDHDRLGRRPTSLRVPRREGNASRDGSVRQTTEAATTRISPTRPRPIVASLTRSRTSCKLTPRLIRIPGIAPGRSPTRHADRKNHGRLPRPAGGHGRERTQDCDPHRFDSTGPYTRAIRLTRSAASAARLQSEYLARGANTSGPRRSRRR